MGWGRRQYTENKSGFREPPRVGRWDFRRGGLGGRDLEMKTGSRVPGEGFRGGGVGPIRKKKVPTHQGLMESPHRTAG